MSADENRASSLLAFLVAGTRFMENLDGTVIATAAPTMATSFGVLPVDLDMSRRPR